MTPKTLLTFVFALGFCLSCIAQDIIWQQETHALVNDRLLEAHNGGSPIEWPRPAFTDIDGDADLDLFVGERNGRIYFYENIGDTTVPEFSLITTYYDSIDVGLHAAPTFHDIDADGDQDLFIGNGSNGCWKGNVVFYRNDGSPTQANWTWVTDSLANIDACDFSTPAFADIDNDGDCEIFVGGGYGRVVYYKNIGTPDSAVWDSVTSSYGPALTDSTFRPVDAGWKAAPTFKDIDSDGDMDWFIGNDQGELHYYENQGTPEVPQFVKITENYAGVSYRWLSYTFPTFADIDGDGDCDLFVGEHYGNINFYRNVGTATEPSWKWEEIDFIHGLETGRYSAPTSGDIDQDGDQDILLGGIRGFIRLFSNIGDEVLANWHFDEDFFPERIQSYSKPVLVDIDNDSLLDIFVGGGSYLHFYHNTSTDDTLSWTFITSQYDSTNHESRSSPAFIDIDNDGDLDLFVGNSTGRLAFYENKGLSDSGTVEWDSISIYYDSIDVGGYSTPTFFDADKDMDYDLFIGNSAGKIHYYKNIGNAQIPEWKFITNNYYQIDVGAYSTPHFSDINGDSLKDLLVGNQNGGLYCWSNTDCLSIDSLSLCQNGPKESLSASHEGGSWRIEGNTIQINQELDPSHLEVGEHQLIYTLAIDGNQELHDTTKVIIHAPPLSNFIYFTSEPNDLTLNLIATDSITGYHYEWNLDNNDTVVGAQVAYIYPGKDTVDICLTVTDTNGCIATNCTTDVRVNIDQQLLYQATTIYPNPSSGTINIQLQHPSFSEAKLTLYDISGRSILTKRLVPPSNDYTINLHQSGLYSIKIETDKAQITKRVVILK